MLVPRRDTQAEKEHMPILSLEIPTLRVLAGKIKAGTTAMMTGNEKQLHTTTFMNGTMVRESGLKVAKDRSSNE